MSLYSPKNQYLLPQQSINQLSPKGEPIHLNFLKIEQQQQFENFKPFRQLPILSQQEQINSGHNDTIILYDSPKVIGAQTPRQRASVMKQGNSNMLRLLQINNLVKRFKNILLNRSHKITLNIAKKIKSSKVFEEKYLSSKRDDTLSSLFSFIIEPTNKIIIFWDIMKGLIILASLLLIPFNWSFLHRDSDKDVVEIKILTFLLAFDMLLKLNIAVIKKGNIIKTRSYIMKQYFFRSFIFDLSFIINLQYAMRQYNIAFLIMFCFIGFVKLQQVIGKIVKLLNLSATCQEFVSLGNLLFTINIIAHFMACIWHYIGMSTIMTQQTSWILVKGLQDESVLIRYIFSYYWAIVTMITVGYGDITPQNYIEAFSCIFLMLLSCAVFTFSLNQVGTIVQNLNKQKRQFGEMLRILTLFMKDHAIPDQLQSRARSYLEYRGLQRNQQSKYNLQNILEQLSSFLQQELMLDVLKNLLLDCPLITLNFSEDTIKKMSNSLQTVYYCPDDFIYHQGQVDDNHLYFIDYGSVEVQEKISQQKIEELFKGKFFGDECFFTQKARKFSVISKSFTKVFRISSTTFQSCLSSEELEVYQQIKHCYQFNLPVLGRKCNICGLQDHQIYQCSQLNYIPDIEKLILKDNEIIQSRALIFHRRLRKTQNSIKIAKVFTSQNELKNMEQQQFFDNVEFEDEGELSIEPQEQEAFELNTQIRNNELQIQLESEQILERKTFESPKYKQKESFSKPSDLSLQIYQPLQNTKGSSDSPKRFPILRQKSEVQTKTKNSQQLQKDNSEADNKCLNLVQVTNHPLTCSSKVIIVEGFEKPKEYKKFLVANNLHAVLQDYNKKARTLGKLCNKSKAYHLFDHTVKKCAQARRTRTSKIIQIH